MPSTGNGQESYMGNNGGVSPAEWNSCLLELTHHIRFGAACLLVFLFNDVRICRYAINWQRMSNKSSDGDVRGWWNNATERRPPGRQDPQSWFH